MDTLCNFIIYSLKRKILRSGFGKSVTFCAKRNYTHLFVLKSKKTYGMLIFEACRKLLDVLCFCNVGSADDFSYFHYLLYLFPL